MNDAPYSISLILFGVLVGFCGGLLATYEHQVNVLECVEELQHFLDSAEVLTTPAPPVVETTMGEQLGLCKGVGIPTTNCPNAPYDEEVTP